MRKNNIGIVFIIIFVITCSTACKKVLDQKPLNIITDEQVWNDPNLIFAYLVNLYNQAHTTGIFTEMGASGGNDLPCQEIVNSGEGRMNYDWIPQTFSMGLLNNSGGSLEYWDYNLIREINTFIVQMKTSKIDTSLLNNYVGEAKFLRAYTYFEMVKRYGGVPIIKEPQEITGGDSLYVKRNTEKEVYDFIGEDCDQSSTLLPESYPSEGVGRATKYAALALKSRAMLYAASEAKYGTVQLNGLVGIPAADADEYWKASLDASKTIMDAGKFQLYNVYPSDKAKNYQMIFLDKNNSEIIWSRKYVSIQAGHRADDYYETNANYSYWGTMYSPTLEMVNAYEDIDGKTDTIDWNNVKGNLPDILKNKDPRLQASILYNGEPWVKDTVRIWLGIYVNGNLLNSESSQYNGMDEVGRDQQTSQGPHTGFQMKKFLDPNRQFPKPDESDQDWIIFRYGEILLNYAEAAYELNDLSEALNSVNQIRTRAGIAELTSITMDEIRQERQVELAFECHRFWDLRRWHIASAVLNHQFHGAFPYFDADKNQFFYKIANCEAYQRIFKDAYYYLPITLYRINNNPNLVENPGY